MEAAEVFSKRIVSPSLGEIEYDENKVVLFPAGIIGFEEFTSFILYEREEFKPFLCLVCLDEPAIYFPLIDPQFIDKDFGSQGLLEEAKNLGLSSIDEADLYCIVTIGGDISQVTVNLRGPMLINPKRLIGKQIILIDSTYLLEHPLHINSN